MKKHKNLIRLIVITAALVACGVIAFKYMRTHKNIEKVYQSDQVKDASLEQIEQNETLQQSPAVSNDEVIIQKKSSSNSTTSSSCPQIGTKCSKSLPCCSPDFCSSSGFCTA